MPRQSARIYYQGKEHKEIYYGGHYHNALLLGGKVAWRKIRGSAYYAFPLQTGGTATGVNNAECIIYPEGNVSNIYYVGGYFPSYKTGNKRMVNHPNGNSPKNSYLVSKDGKLWEEHEVSYAIRGFSIAEEGFFYMCRNNGLYEYYYVGTDGDMRPAGETRLCSEETLLIGDIVNMDISCGMESMPPFCVTRYGTDYTVLDKNGSMKKKLLQGGTVAYAAGRLIHISSIYTSTTEPYTTAVKVQTSSNLSAWDTVVVNMPFTYIESIAAKYVDGLFILYVYGRKDSSRYVNVYSSNDFRKFSFVQIPEIVSLKLVGMDHVNTEFGYHYEYADIILGRNVSLPGGHLNIGACFPVNEGICCKNGEISWPEGFVSYRYISGSSNQPVIIGDYFYGGQSALYSASQNGNIEAIP